MFVCRLFNYILNLENDSFPYQLSYVIKFTMKDK